MLVAATAAVALVTWHGRTHGRRYLRRRRHLPVSRSIPSGRTPIRQQTGIGLNYQSIGSGGGIKQIKAKTVTFGASDMPLKPEELKAAGLVQFPMIIGGVVPVVNIKGVAPGQLVLDGATSPRSTWARSPSGTTRDQEAQPEARAAGHGDRAGLPLGRLGHQLPVHGLPVQVEPEVQGLDRRQRPPCNGRSGIGAKGNEGVANMTTQTDGAIGYVEYAYAKQNKMAYALLINKAARRSRRALTRSRPPPPTPTGRMRTATT